MTLRRFVVTLTAIVLCYVSMAGQGIDVGLLNLDVSVTDRTDDFVVGLTRSSQQGIAFRHYW